MAKVLLHTCCASCLIYPYARLTEEENEVTSFFYNPNIHPFNEYQERLRSVKKCCEELNISLIIGDYDLKEYFRRVSFHENKRCLACYDLRLRKTAEEARERGYDAFSTILTISPYQSLQAIKEIGDKIAEETGAKFFFRDFRSGFKESHKRAKEMGLYFQKYCGCIFSERERYDEQGGPQ